LTGNTFTPVAIPDGFSSCVTCGITQDGQILAGSCSNDLRTIVRTFTQVAGGAPTFLPSPSAIKDAECVAMSSSGNRILGSDQLVWSSYSGWTDITGNAPNTRVKVAALDRFGNHVVGWYLDGRSAWRWTKGQGYEFVNRWINPGEGMSFLGGRRGEDRRHAGFQAGAYWQR
jgi:hypothetical protein